MERLAYIEAGFGQLYRDFVVGHLVLVGSSVSLRVHKRTRVVITLTRTRAKIALTVEKTCCAGETSTAFIFRISILSSKDTLTLRVRVNIIAGLVWGVLVR